MIPVKKVKSTVHYYWLINTEEVLNSVLETDFSTSTLCALSPKLFISVANQALSPGTNYPRIKFWHAGIGCM